MPFDVIVYPNKLKALLATSRIANVPSVVSNLSVGILLGSSSSGSQFTWPWLLMIAAILFYVGANFLNDFTDRNWDRVKRPERALPSCLFRAKSYLHIARICFAVSLIICAFHGVYALMCGVLLLILILLYTAIHKKTSLGVIPMGLCRAMLPLLGCSASMKGFSVWVALPSLALFLYIVALSLSARYESSDDFPASKKQFSRTLLIAAGCISALVPSWLDIRFGWMGLIPFGLWLALSLHRYRIPVSTHVSALLAGIPLLDWIILLPISWIWLSLGRVNASHPMFLLALMLPLCAFATGRSLQKLAPAT